MSDQIPIECVSVKVMRSFDYCHFEVCLTTSAVDGKGITIEQADELRKKAARLADKAVSQYKVAKNNFHLVEYDASALQRMYSRRTDILEKPEGERSPKEQALLKTLSDSEYRKRPHYDYEDHWEEPEYENYEHQDDIF